MAKAQQPVYVASVVPTYAMRDYVNGGYTAWFIGHPDEARLYPDVINTLFREEFPDGDCDELEVFFRILADGGYTVFHSASHGGVIELRTL
jgi:hypothetical protein